MVGTIVPMVHREKRGKTFFTAAWMYSFGCVLGASLLGIVLGVIGKFLLLIAPNINSLKLASLAGGVVGLVYSFREARILKIPVIQLYRQVPESRRRYMSSGMASLYYGIELGFGVVTRIPISSFYVVAIWALFTESVALSCLSFVGFGLGKGLPLFILAGSQDYADGKFDVLRILSNCHQAVLYLNGLILCVVSSILIINGLYK
jgi:hypothetical protein